MSTQLHVAYFGSPSFSALLLEYIIKKLSEYVTVDLVVTQPDKPVGKKQIITPSPVKQTALKYKIPVWNYNLHEDGVFFPTWESQQLSRRIPTGEKKKDVKVQLITLLKKVDLAIVFAYGFKQLIPLDLLKAPKLQFDIGDRKTSGFINIHPSLLPRYRGSSPIAYPILLGEHHTGVSLFVMDEKMDHGPLVMQEKIKITLNDVRTDMETKLTKIGFQMLKKLLSSTDFKRIHLIPQNHAFATYAPYMTKQDGFVEWTTIQKALKNEPITFQELPHIIRSYIQKYKSQITNNKLQTSLKFQNPKVEQFEDCEIGNWKLSGDYNLELELGASSKIIYNFWRGISPWPGLWTRIPLTAQPKRLELAHHKRLKIIKMEFKEEALTISRVQLEGKKEVDFPTFQKAYRLI